MKNHLHIVILNWNGYSDTVNCIDSILMNIKDNDHINIFVIDNGSSSQETENLKEACKNKFDKVVICKKEDLIKKDFNLPIEYYTKNKFSKVVFIENNENLGFAGGNNVALNFILQFGGKYALLLNNDTEVEGNALETMFDILKNKINNDIVAVIPQIRYFHDKNLIWNCGGKINRLGVRKYYFADMNFSNLNLKDTMTVDYGTGCALLLDLDETGPLSEKFFFGEEDFELALRLRNNNKKIVCNLNAIIYHKVGASRDKFSDKFYGNMVYHYSQRLSNLKEHLPSLNFFISLTAHFFSSIRILYVNKCFKFRILIEMWKDIIYNIKNLNKYTKEDFAAISRKVY